MTNCKFRNVLKRELLQTNDNMKEQCIKQNKNRKQRTYQIWNLVSSWDLPPDFHDLLAATSPICDERNI